MTNWTDPQERWFYGTIRSAQHALDIIGRGTTMPAYAFQLARDESGRIEQAMALTPRERVDEATRLLAAVPDLLAALQVARRYAYPQPATAEHVNAPDLVAMIDAAIAKATPVLSLSDSEVRS